VFHQDLVERLSVSSGPLGGPKESVLWPSTTLLLHTSTATVYSSGS